MVCSFCADKETRQACVWCSVCGPAGAVFDPNGPNFVAPLLPVVLHVSVVLAISVLIYR